MQSDITTIIIKNKDSAVFKTALEEYQKTRGIKILPIRFGINNLRLTFQDITNKHKKI